IQYKYNRTTLYTDIRDRNKLEKIETKSFDSSQNYKYDETGSITAQDYPKVLANKVTICFAVNAIDDAISSPFIIFLRVKYSEYNGITLLTIPFYCSNKLQPFDIAIYFSFKTIYNIAMSNWMVSNLGKTVTIYNIPLFVKDFL
ncbi:hypothetical protein ALC56_06688, partial [Trachymyrmex septentrionalis]